MRKFTKEMKENDPKIATAWILEILDGGIAHLENIQRTFIDSISNK